MIIIAWVNVAMVKLVRITFSLMPPDGVTWAWHEDPAYWVVGGAMLFVAIYSSMSGLKGVAITDVVQFGIAMTGCVILAVLMVLKKNLVLLELLIFFLR
jgi:Na+/proline symporter